MSRVIRQTFNTSEVKEIYEKWGDDCLLIDIANARTYDTNGIHYITIKIKNLEGVEVEPKFKVREKMISTRLSAPEDRLFEPVKVGIVHRNDNDSDKEFFYIWEKLSKLMESKFEELIKNKIINVDKQYYKSKEKGKINVKSGELKTPYQKDYRDSDGNFIAMDHRFWVTLPFKFMKKEETAQLKQYDSCTYQNGFPFLIKDFNFIIKDLKKTKKIIKNRKEYTVCDNAKTENGEDINNTNIHEFLTPKSIISGVFSIKITSSLYGINIRAEFSQTLYVEKGEYDEFTAFDDDEMEDIFKNVKIEANNNSNEILLSDDDNEDFEDE